MPRSTLDRPGIEVTSDRKPSALQDVGVDHRRLHVLVAEEFLNRADVVAVGGQVGGEAMAQGVRGDVFVDAGLAGGIAHGALDGAGVDVILATVEGASDP